MLYMKHGVNSRDDIISKNNVSIIDELHSWIKHVPDEKIKVKRGRPNKTTQVHLNSCVLIGPVGSGKNSILHIFLKELKSHEIIHMNDIKLSKKSINTFISEAVSNKSIEYDKKILVIDELDFLLENDSQLFAEFIKNIKEIPIPFISTADEKYTTRLNDHKNTFKIVRIHINTPEEIQNFVSKIKNTKASYSTDVRKVITNLEYRSEFDDYSDDVNEYLHKMHMTPMTELQFNLQNIIFENYHNKSSCLSICIQCIIDGNNLNSEYRGLLHHFLLNSFIDVHALKTPTLWSKLSYTKYKLKTTKMAILHGNYTYDMDAISLTCLEKLNLKNKNVV